jgi:hypothetical protein
MRLIIIALTLLLIHTAVQLTKERHQRRIDSGEIVLRR